MNDHKIPSISTDVQIETFARFRNTNYEVSNLGMVRNSSAGRMLAAYPDRDGYLCVSIRIDGRPKHLFVHRMVMEAFCGPAPEDKMVAHLDGNKKNCRRDNLMYATRSENESHKRLHGKMVEGTKCHAAKMTPDTVDEDRKLYQQGTTAKSLAIKRGVAKSTMLRALRGTWWKSV